jgi:malonyl CoA-acyl carrier protein transacylase
LRLVQQRGSLMIKASEASGVKLGTLIIKFREDKLPKIKEKLASLKLEISCYNSPTNIVVSGEVETLTELKNYMKT